MTGDWPPSLVGGSTGQGEASAERPVFLKAALVVPSR